MSPTQGNSSESEGKGHFYHLGNMLGSVQFFEEISRGLK